MFRNELKPAICKKSGILSKKVLQHHDNACTHTVAATVETVQQLGFELQHPPYSPDLAPSHREEALRCRRFTTDEKAKKMLHT